jgi:hypothetical protein
MAHNGNAALRLIAAAMMFARRKYPDRRRRSAYVDQLYFTWYVLLMSGGVMDMTALVACVLQHVLKHGQTTPDEVEEKFGSGVRRVVEELTEERKLTHPARRAARLRLAPQLSDAAKAIWLADTIVNLRTLRIDQTIDASRDDIAWAEKVVRATRGVNARLDVIAEGMLDHARKLLDDARNGRWPPKPRKPAGERYNDPFLKADAEAGIGSLTIFWDNARTARVKIDSRPIFTLPLTLARMLWIIAFFGKPGQDGLSAFVLKRAILVELRRITGRPYKLGRHSIDRILYRLQNALYLNGVNPRLVEMCRKRGVRLRLHIGTLNPRPPRGFGELVTIQ